MRVRIDEQEPIPLCDGSTAISRPGDLVDGFEHDDRARRLCDLARPVGGVIVTDDDFVIPTSPDKHVGCLCDFGQRYCQKLLLVERGNDDGNVQMQSM